MDLGAGICSVRNPACLACPTSIALRGANAGIAEALPVKPAKTAKPARTGTAYWIEREEQVWLVKRPGKGMLAGMRALPDDGWAARRDGDSVPPFAAEWCTLNEAVPHVFTHFSLTLAVAVTSSPVHAETLGRGRVVAGKIIGQRRAAHPIHESSKARIGAQGETEPCNISAQTNLRTNRRGFLSMAGLGAIAAMRLQGLCLSRRRNIQH